MTSKEALEKIKEIIRSTRDTDLIHFYHLSTDLTDKEVEMFNVIEKDLDVLHKLGARLLEIYEEISKKLKFIQWKIDIAKKDTPTEAYSQGEYDTLDIVNRVYIDDLVTIISKLWSE